MTCMTAEMMEDAALFDYAAPPPVSLADKFIVPPFSVLDARGGVWQDRKRRWLKLGIESEVGRADGLTYNGHNGDPVSLKIADIGTTSIFDPVTCELAYRWFTPPGARVLDPFAGGSVRGVTASVLARWYYGVELRAEQVEANRTPFTSTRKLTRKHQHLLVFVKGDAKKAATYAKGEA